MTNFSGHIATSEASKPGHEVLTGFQQPYAINFQEEGCQMKCSVVSTNLVTIITMVVDLRAVNTILNLISPSVLILRTAAIFGRWPSNSFSICANSWSIPSWVTICSFCLSSFLNVIQVSVLLVVIHTVKTTGNSV